MTAKLGGFLGGFANPVSKDQKEIGTFVPIFISVNGTSF
jgi:hypothetical protein